MSDKVSYGEFIQVHTDVFDSHQKSKYIELFSSITHGTDISESIVAELNDVSLTSLSHYQDTSMSGIPWCEDGENYYVELDVGHIANEQLNLHNNANQLHHLVHVLYHLSDSPLTLFFPSENIEVIVPPGASLLYPSNFSFRFILTSPNADISFVRIGFAFKSEN